MTNETELLRCEFCATVLPTRVRSSSQLHCQRSNSPIPSGGAIQAHYHCVHNKTVADARGKVALAALWSWLWPAVARQMQAKREEWRHKSSNARYWTAMTT